MGISPDIIVMRADEPIDPDVFEKIALFCNVKRDCVIENITVPVLYEAPNMLEKSRFSWIACRELGIDAGPCDLTEWNAMLDRIRAAEEPVEIGLVGKYVKLHDAYLSVAEALRHGGYETGCKVTIRWVEAEDVEATSAAEQLQGVDGILVPGGFGDRGIEGKIAAARYAREEDIPYFGICLGMQTAVIALARDVLGLPDVNSGEFAPDCAHKVIDFMPDQNGDMPKGGTMRLGAYPCVIRDDTIMARAYGKKEIAERHRHRYEFNNDYREKLTAAGLTLSGISPDGRLVETVELSDLPFYVGVQYHPEFKSRPDKAHPLFREFIRAAHAYRTERG